MKRLIAIAAVVSLLLGGAVQAQDDQGSSSRFVFTQEMLQWLCSNSPESLPEDSCHVEEPEPVAPEPTEEPEPVAPEPTEEPEPVAPETSDESLPPETLSYWQRPGTIERVDELWACLIGSYHHTCEVWITGSGARVNCATAGCDPTA